MKKTVLVSLLVISLCLCWQDAASETEQDSTENVVQADTLLRLTAADSTALEEIKALIKGGNYAEVETQARELLAKVEAEHGTESLEAAEVLDQLVEALWRGGKASEAESEELAERAIAIKEKHFGPEHLKLANSVNNLAVLYMVQGKYVEAEPLYKRTLAIREKALGLEHPNVAASLNNLAILYWNQGKYVEAEPLYNRALAIDEKALGPDHPYVATDLNNLAILSHEQGKYAVAEPLYKRALSIWEKALGPDHPDVASSLNNLALLYSDQGKYAEAEPLYKRSLAIKEKALGPEHPDVATCLNNLAILYMEQGKYAEAELLHKRALVIKEKALGPDHPYVARDLNNLAILSHEQGKYAVAEPLYKRALSIWEKALGPDHPDVATSLDNLAELYAEQGKYAEAEPLHKRALAIREKALGPEHPNVAMSLNNLANLYADQAKYAEAEPLYKRALAITEKALGPEHPYLADYIESFSGHHRLTGDGKKALELAGRAFQIRKKNFRDGSTAMSERDALTYSQFLRSSVSNYLSCHFELESSDRAAAVEAAAIVFSCKGQVSDGMFERQKALVTETDSTTLALAESLRFTKFQLSKLFVQGPDEDVESYGNEVDSLMELANNLEADLSRHSASFRKQQDYKNIGVGRIASRLPEQSVLVEYLKYDYLQLKPDSTIPRYLAIVVTSDKEPVIINVGDASEIDPIVDRYRKHMLGVSRADRLPTVVDKHNYKEISEGLYTTIWQPIEGYMADKDLVLIAPDGALNMVSFAGLMDGDGKYLIERFPIHYLSSGRDLIRLKDEPTPATGLFALGDPDYNASATARLPRPATPEDTVSEPVYYATRNVRSGCGTLKDITVDPLPGTRKEVEWIAAGWKESTDEPAVVYFGSHASEENFKAEGPGRRVIHLATHGYFLEGACQPDIPKKGFDSDVGFVGENPLLLSGLFFAGANLHGEGADSAGAEDGILTAYEVSAMDLEGTELVVLSACETGLGKVKEGEGVYGLRRAFQMAGARTVISALWPVSDKTTADMMSRLYDRKGESLPETIRRIQLKGINELRSQNKADHPFSWGAFIALGDWR